MHLLLFSSPEKLSYCVTQHFPFEKDIHPFTTESPYLIVSSFFSIVQILPSDLCKLLPLPLACVTISFSPCTDFSLHHLTYLVTAKYQTQVARWQGEQWIEIFFVLKPDVLILYGNNILRSCSVLQTAVLSCPKNAVWICRQTQQFLTLLVVTGKSCTEHFWTFLFWDKCQHFFFCLSPIPDLQAISDTSFLTMLFSLLFHVTPLSYRDGSEE